MDIDYDRALLLLNVIEKALGHPQLRPIVVAASDELNAMITPPKEEVEEAPIEASTDDSTDNKPGGLRRFGRSESEKGGA